MGILYGNFDLSIDDKCRLLVPAEVRKSIDLEGNDNAFFMTEGLNGVPWLYPIRAYEAMVAKERSDLTPEDDLLDFDHMNFATASRLELDKQGRVLIPQATLNSLNLDREVTLVGSRDHLEVWNRPAWKQHLADLRARKAEIALRRRKALEEQEKVDG